MENPAPTTLQYPQHALVRPTTLCETKKSMQNQARPSTPKHVQPPLSTTKAHKTWFSKKRLQKEERRWKLFATSVWGN